MIAAMPSNHHSTPTKIIVGTPLYSKSSSVSMPTDLITFQHDQSCVFVKPAESYQEAINIARKEFDELVNIPSDRIAFTLDESSTSGRRQIRISESAWCAVTAKLPRGAIINIIIRPDVDTKAPPPQYLEVPSPSSGRSSPQTVRHSRSDNEIHRVRSNGSGRSTKSTKSSSRKSFLGIGIGK